MSTRGFICFVVDGRPRTAYCHNDSEPASVGVEVLRWLRTATADMESLRQQVQNLRDVDYSMKPTAEDIQRLLPYARSGGSLEDWDNLLRRTQGNPALILEAGVILDQTWFAADSLHAEWGYVIDLDGEGLFEVYRGRQRKPHQLGRFAAMEPIPGRTSYEGSRTSQLPCGSPGRSPPCRMTTPFLPAPN